MVNLISPAVAMTWWHWALVVIGGWSAVAVLMGLGLGVLISRGKRQRMRRRIQRDLFFAARMGGR